VPSFHPLRIREFVGMQFASTFSISYSYQELYLPLRQNSVAFVVELLRFRRWFGRVLGTLCCVCEGSARWFKVGGAAR